MFSPSFLPILAQHNFVGKCLDDVPDYLAHFGEEEIMIGADLRILIEQTLSQHCAELKLQRDVDKDGSRYLSVLAFVMLFCSLTSSWRTNKSIKMFHRAWAVVRLKLQTKSLAGVR